VPRGEHRERAIDYFLGLFTVDDLKNCVTFTNDNAKAKGAGSAGGRRWVAVTLADMVRFIAVVFAMSLHWHYGAYTTYWSKHPVIGDPFISSIMSCVAFAQIQRFLRVVDPGTTQPMLPSGDADPLRWVRPLQSAINDRLCAAVVAGQWVTLDESMGFYRGRLMIADVSPCQPFLVSFCCYNCAQCTLRLFKTSVLLSFGVGVEPPDSSVQVTQTGPVASSSLHAFTNDTLLMFASYCTALCGVFAPFSAVPWQRTGRSDTSHACSTVSLLVQEQ